MTHSPNGVSIHPDPQALVAATAARLITKLVDVQSRRGEATVVLTGGTVGIATLEAVTANPARTAVDWTRVNFWWGDERFLPAGHPELNSVQARKAMLEPLGVPAARIHACATADDVASVEDAAADYATRLAEAAADEHLARGFESVDPRLPRFDVLLLGVGPDAHIASLFPETPGVRTTGQTTVAVRDAPKPPPERISLTLESITTAAEVWLGVAGKDKAGAVGLALAGAGEIQVPAAGARGRTKTRWLIDQAAASQLSQRLFASEDTEAEDA
ncbi:MULTISPECIES: 6-phosphogluconolactonase [unclassified Arthrobacter]|uniref:6-phosphogluconolactonase n=1 Tax=unclassified Arthrobacter TaxID=235627 RepID=UPI001E3F911E|nr:MULTISPECIES: 6-phosphogluconolactonase [unclassified Arthrobacter]MCC9145371.1 6-phosphogluconolactonase [Arthrobacter sp. zg-Y919]MDK1276599.1 6-phosphogluconolactonase [Arthrobacter sp. zg.Y919]WIB01813.1 6-phosphogluconolactonase [Arthrobacter sp. zg-Y919]